MSGLPIGKSVLCVVTQILEEEEAVEVRILETNTLVRISLPQLFPCGEEDNCKFFSGTVVQRDSDPWTRVDPIRVDRTFVAKVTGHGPLTLSRRTRIEDLWEELEYIQGTREYVAATVTGQNKDYYYLSLEGNIRATTPKGPLASYLRESLNTLPLWHKHVPVEGDTLAARVVFADCRANELRLDLVSALESVRTGELPDELLRLLGGQSSGRRPFPPNALPQNTSYCRLPCEYDIAHSPALLRAREEHYLQIIDDDLCYAHELAWVLSQLGYSTEVIDHAHVRSFLESSPDPMTTALVNVNMTPVNGIEIVSERLARFPQAKCILMSALRPDDPLESGQSLAQAAREVRHQCLFWHKPEADLEKPTIILDDLILDYTGYLAHAASTFTIPPDEATKPPVTESENNLPDKSSDVLSNILTKLKENSKGGWGALFKMERKLWRVEALACEDFLRSGMLMDGAQGYLTASPVRDISYQQEPLLIDNDVAANLPRYRNLLRFFSPSGIDEWPEEPYFRSIAAIRLNIETETRYSLFLFDRRSNAFHRDQIVPLLQHAAAEAELILIQRIQSSHARNTQSFYMEGLARSGLRHDAFKQLPKVQLLAAHALSALKEGNQGEAEAKVGALQNELDELIRRLAESLDRLGRTSRSTSFDIRQVVDRATSIAAGMARRLSSEVDTSVIRIGRTYPDDQRMSVSGDPNALQRILENLLVNAVEHGTAIVETGLRSCVQIRMDVVRASAESDYPFCILVHDTGPGIHGFHTDSIFRPLFSTKEEGFGMGLAVTRQIAEETGIVVELLASSLLCGTTFAVRIPQSMRPTLQE